MNRVTASEAADPATESTKTRHLRSAVLGGKLLRNWPATFGAIVLTLFALLALAAPWVTKHNPLETNSSEVFESPSLDHPFGTDEHGRDLFSRVLYGGRVSLGTAAAVVIIAGLVGVTLGLGAGFYRGWTESITMRVMDLIFAFPPILLAMGLVAVLGQSAVNGAIAVSIVSVPAFARLTRATVMAQKEREYVEAARAIGAPDLRLMFRTILPNCVGPLFVQITVVAVLAVLLEAALSFLGLGPRPPTPSWGQMLSTGRDFLYHSPWYGVFPGLAITLVVLSLNGLADLAQRVAREGWRAV